MREARKGVGLTEGRTVQCYEEAPVHAGALSESSRILSMYMHNCVLQAAAPLLPCQCPPALGMQVALYSSAPSRAAYASPATLHARVGVVLQQLITEAATAHGKLAGRAGLAAEEGAQVRPVAAAAIACFQV